MCQILGTAVRGDRKSAQVSIARDDSERIAAGKWKSGNAISGVRWLVVRKKAQCNLLAPASELNDSHCFPCSKL